MKKVVLASAIALALTGCVTAPPKHQDNICRVFKQYPKWYKAAKASRKRWGIPISVQMSVIHQESHFKAKAKPGRKHLLGVVPWSRLSTANGYSQALNGTWKAYKKSTGKKFASRKSFSDSVDFIGWYLNKAARELHLSKKNAYSLYLAYHEGIGGYRKKTYSHKPWLKKVAQKVSAQSSRYRSQLLKCEYRLR